MMILHITKGYLPSLKVLLTNSQCIPMTVYFPSTPGLKFHIT